MPYVAGERFDVICRVHGHVKTVGSESSAKAWRKNHAKGAREPIDNVTIKFSPTREFIGDTGY